MTRILTTAVLIFSLMTSFAQTKTFYINSQQQNCTGVAPMKCLQYKENSFDAWKLLYQKIDGFEFEPGYFYTIKVKAVKIKNPPADGSSIQYKLKKIMSKEKDTNMDTLERSPKGKWIITQLMMGGKLSDISARAYEFEFKTEGNQIATKICNATRGGYSISGNKIQFGNLMSTKMMCPDMDYEASFNQAISSVDNFEYDRNKMILKKGTETIMVLSMPVH